MSMWMKYSSSTCLYESLRFLDNYLGGCLTKSLTITLWCIYGILFHLLMNFLLSVILSLNQLPNCCSIANDLAKHFCFLKVLKTLDYFEQLCCFNVRNICFFSVFFQGIINNNHISIKKLINRLTQTRQQIFFLFFLEISWNYIQVRVYFLFISNTSFSIKTTGQRNEFDLLGFFSSNFTFRSLLL